MPQIDSLSLRTLIDSNPMLKAQLEAEAAEGMVPPEVAGIYADNGTSWLQSTGGGGSGMSDGLANTGNTGNERDMSIEHPPQAGRVGLANQVLAHVQRMRPINPLDPGEIEELRGYQQRNARLAPMEMAAPYSLGSARIPGNVYSIDTRGAATSARNAIASVINGVRAKRRDSYGPRMAALGTQYAQNAENKAFQDEFYMKHFPDLVTTEYTEAADAARENNRFNNRLIENTQQYGLDVSLEDIKAQHKLNERILEIESDKAQNDPKLMASILKEYAESMTPEISILEFKVKRLNEQLSDISFTEQHGDLREELIETENLLRQTYAKRAEILRNSGATGLGGATDSTQITTDLTEVFR